MRRGMKRRILAMFLCVVMIFSLTVSSYAERAEEVVEVPHVVMNIDEEMQSSDDVATVDVNVDESPEQNEESRDEAVCEDESTGDVSETEGSTDAENIDMSIENSDTTCQEDGTNEDSIQENVSQESEEESEGTLNEGGNETESETEPETTPTGKWKESQSVPGKSENAETADQIPDEEATDGEVNITPDTEESNSVPEETEPEATEPEGTEPEGVKTEGTEPERDEGPAAELETASDSNPKYDGCEYCGADADEEHAADCITNCTCSCENGEHAEDCPLYDGPECTCEFLSHIHEKECELYVEPIPAKVYMEENGEYTLVEEHNADKPFDVRAYDDKTLYVVSTEYPQNLYFERNKKFLGSDYGANYTISNKEYCKLDVYNQAKGDTYKNASLTLAGDIPADMEVTLTATTVLKDFWIEDWVDTEYTITIRIIDELPTEEVVRKETLVDGTAISAEGTGIPETVTLTASAVSSEEYHSEIGNFIEDLSNLLFAYDITLLDSDGELWQPESGEKVTVTLDVSDMEVENGDKIGILHDHDGTLSKLGEYTVTDGMITFETGGFSVFYGYTVDFEYDGVWYSIGGGSNIYLYELFAALGIDEYDASEAVDVEFSDPDLIEVSRVVVDGYTGEEGWLLESLEPFSSEETLTISFYDGNEIVIKVYDATYTTLSNNLTLNSEDVINGATVSGNITITLNGNVTIKNQITVPTGNALTIQGKGVLKRDSSFIGRMFSVEGGTLTIDGSNISIDGGASWTSEEVDNSTREKLTVASGKNVTSSAIYVENNGTVNLTGITLENLYTAAKGQAPAIHVTGDSGTNTDSEHATVNMNNVTVTDCATLSGQAITLFNDCLANLTNCKYVNNYSGGTYAGALKAGGPTYFSQLNMTNCEASGNYSSGWGGVLLWAANNDCGGKSSKATIDGCTFSSNKARYLGGALSNEAIMEVKNTTIKENIAMAGGGIATFPFTLTETHEGGGNACGLTLGSGNIIQDNLAFASGDFTPFSSTEDGANGDDTTITNKITYTGGGGGVWCYMNKPGWTCSLDVGSGNQLVSNAANNVGGGVYVHNVASAGTTLSISGAEIIENTAPNGGGVAVKEATVTIDSGAIKRNIATVYGGGIYVDNGTCTVSGTGSVSENTAANGGGIYIDSGSSLTVSGGIISSNKAECKKDMKHEVSAYDDAINCGVGGGIYVSSGTNEENRSSFNMTAADESQVGIHSNEADYAAADVYSSGVNTTLTLPSVNGMDLAGYNGKATDWYADYCAGDNNYPKNTIDAKMENPGRYDVTENDNVAVEADKLSTTKTYFCLTLGKTYGELKITKKLVDNQGNPYTATEDQSFLFHVQSADENSNDETEVVDITVIVTVKRGESEASITIAHIPEGNYIITEDENWGWRFEIVVDSEMGSFKEKRVEIAYDSANPERVFANKREESKWLSHDCYVENWFHTDGIKKRDEDNVVIQSGVSSTPPEGSSAI